MTIGLGSSDHLNLSDQKEDLDSEVLNYSSVPLIEVLSAVAFSYLMKDEQLSILEQVRQPILDVLRSLRQVLPIHGSTFRDKSLILEKPQLKQPSLQRN